MNKLVKRALWNRTLGFYSFSMSLVACILLALSIALAYWSQDSELSSLYFLLLTIIVPLFTLILIAAISSAIMGIWHMSGWKFSIWSLVLNLISILLSIVIIGAFIYTFVELLIPWDVLLHR